MVQQLRRRLEEVSAADSLMPTVLLVVGDDTLTTQEALQVYQQKAEEDPLWVISLQSSWGLFPRDCWRTHGW